jgi:hypothetical protein
VSEQQTTAEYGWRPDCSGCVGDYLEDKLKYDKAIKSGAPLPEIRDINKADTWAVQWVNQQVNAGLQTTMVVTAVPLPMCKDRHIYAAQETDANKAARSGLALG